MDNQAHFSGICMEKCKGLCCDPWWGIISYTMVKTNGLANLDGFRGDVIKGIRLRQERITTAYVTNERPRRSLFKSPERYNVSVQSVRANGPALEINILAMFAFRCLYLSVDNACLIHPAALGGKDIRPPHCAALGAPNARPNEKGYCRVIHAAQAPSASDASIAAAVEFEKNISRKSFSEGVSTIEAAAVNVIKGLKDYCAKELPLEGAEPPQGVQPHLPLKEKPAAPGRNDPCWCGSNLKYKKCHGR